MQSPPKHLELITVPYISLFNAGILRGDPSDESLCVDRHFLQFCVRSIIQHIRVDEDWYLKKYRDIEAAIQRGEQPDARTHYCRFGYFENRMPYKIDVDADWYCAQYPDVQEALERREYLSAQTHFDEVGFAEGRLPYARFTLAVESTESADRGHSGGSLRLVPMTA